MRKEKQFLLDEVKDQIDEFDSFVITQYAGINANEIAGFRTTIANIGGDVQMVRKRILIKAAAAAGIELDEAMLPGHIGVVFAGKDAIETTKAVFKFSKDSESRLSVVGGRIDGRLYSGADVQKLSELPSMDQMRAQFLSVLEAPMSNTVSVMDAILTSVLFCLDNKSKQ